MPNYVIERELPAAGLTARAGSGNFTEVLRRSGGPGSRDSVNRELLSPKTRSTVSTSRQWSDGARTRQTAAFRRTAFQK
jgi:hypothetical protein